jgi:hypothetical protein
VTTEAARRYLQYALGHGDWHELEGLWILARGQGVPRRAFNRALVWLPLDRERRGFLEEWFVRLVPDPDELTVLRALRELVAGGGP